MVTLLLAMSVRACTQKNLVRPEYNLATGRRSVRAYLQQATTFVLDSHSVGLRDGRSVSENFEGYPVD